VWDEHALKLSVDIPNSNSWVYNATISAMNSWNTMQQYFVNHYYSNDTQPDSYYFYATNNSNANIQITPLNTLSFPGMIAYTLNLGQNRFHIYVATEVMTAPGMEKEYYLTLLHELGHVFGIGDVFGAYNDVMNALVSNSTMLISTLDLYTIRLLAVSTLAPNTFVYLPPALPYTQFTFN
jgi:hypothetical protein